MGRLFGTDGVRGVANRELTPELAFNLIYQIPANTCFNVRIIHVIRQKKTGSS